MDSGVLLSLAQLVALISAALFFGYKFVTGYFRLDLSVLVTCQRENSTENGLDTLVVTTLLEKGTDGTLELHDAQAKIAMAGRIEYLDFPGIRRSSYVDGSDELTSGINARINWNEDHAKSPRIHMTPGEKTEIALFCRVPSEEVCTIEVAIAGRKSFGILKSFARIFGQPKMGQWKACSVSLPKMQP